jgi:hypothetical protein
MKLDDAARSSGLMKTVDILCNDPGEQSFSFERREGVMSYVWLGRRDSGPAIHAPSPITRSRS